METRELVLPADGASSDFERGLLFLVGTATVLIHYAVFTLLTDQNFLHQGKHVHLHYGIRSDRWTNPAIEIEDLPSLDFVKG